MFFDTLCVSFSFVFFKFLVFEAAVYVNKDVYVTHNQRTRNSEHAESLKSGMSDARALSGVHPLVL